MSTGNLRLLADASTGCFPVVIFSACKIINTHHRCFPPVPKGGMRHGDGDGRVCSRLICGPCSSKFGNETVIRCTRHAIEQDTENIETRQTTKATNRTAEYSARELLILSQAYIKASENSIEGAARRLSKFWDDVSDNYHELKKQQEEYNNRQRKHKLYKEWS
jgi:hypothetical protein